ncbi:hypothetical protein FQA39_LY17965 [Lamprigera yunnana]|nr:hypothetical protein FQA39_LY17965 [Lamprigera yunnana]
MLNVRPKRKWRSTFYSTKKSFAMFELRELIKLEMKYQYEDDSPHSNSEQKLKRYRWSCNKCNQMFVTVRELREHRKVHRKQENMVQYSYKLDKDGDMFICLTCDAECKTKEEMEKHVLQHEEKFICDVCKESFLKPYEYTCHLFNHDPSKGFSCPFCKYPVTIYIHGTYLNPSHQKKQHECNICLKSFKWYSSLTNHIKTHSEERPFKCGECSKCFKSLKILNSHTSTHSGVLYQCDICFKDFKAKHRLELHKSRHDSKFDAFCSMCSQGFYSRQDLNEHLLKVHNNKLFNCEICEKPFKQRQFLKAHMQSHSVDYSSVKEHKCELCGKAYKYKTSLMRHIRVHNGDEKWVCDICGKVMTSKPSLRDHMFIHAGVKPFHCTMCEKSFSKRNTLRIHLRSHKGIKLYRCDTCEKSFTQRSSLVVHIRRHTGEKPYKCNLCNNDFVCKTNLALIAPQQTKHPIKECVQTIIDEVADKGTLLLYLFHKQLDDVLPNMIENPTIKVDVTGTLFIPPKYQVFKDIVILNVKSSD